MTGPSYPRPPVAGSNGIGLFQIGVSSIGDIVPFDVWLTIISQYGNSPVLTKLITNWDEYIDQTVNFTNFFDLIWNIETAQGAGLDIWGRIVGVSRVVVLASERFFGFEEQNLTTDPFNTSPFYSGASATSNFYVSDQAYRTLILAKAAANITNGSSESINQILLNLFPKRGNCYVIDNGGMLMTYNFGFVLTPVEQAIVKQSGVLPKSTGVRAEFTMFGLPF